MSSRRVYAGVVDWKLDDPAGQGIDSVRPIRDEIKKLVEDLITGLTVQGP